MNDREQVKEYIKQQDAVLEAVMEAQIFYFKLIYKKLNIKRP